MTDANPGPDEKSQDRWTPLRSKKTITAAIAAVIGAAVIAWASVAGADVPSSGRPFYHAQLVCYLGVYEPNAPSSYVEVDQFAHAIGKQPNVVTYYSQWEEPFQVNFVTSAAQRGAETVVQIAPRNISLASIADGQYDSYLQSYADAVKAFGSPVVLSFGHEMNGDWYSWGDHHTSPTTFVAAWRHIVDVFRRAGATNATWMWTVNIVDALHDHVPDPAPWWPGPSYVNWVGIDGYYYSPTSTFASLFGPTIFQVRSLTKDPILIAETGASAFAGQASKIADLFTGVREFGLLGFVWFDKDGATALQDFRIRGAGAVTALRRGSNAYVKTRSASQSCGQQLRPAGP